MSDVKKLVEALRGFVPSAILPELGECAEKFEINTPLRIAHFLAQCTHESGGFVRREENLNYSAKRLREVWPSRFSSLEVAEKYAHNPKALGSKVYAGRMGNGNEESGDGYKFRGRGYIQLTGKNNYEKCGLALGVDLVENPDLVAEKYPLLSAAWFWKENGLNAAADKSDDNVTTITRRVNGGLTGAAEREAAFHRLYRRLQKAVAP